MSDLRSFGTGDCVIVPYSSEWPVMFAAEAQRLRAALGPAALRIDHHGSTAVPGLAAKPIIDIQISVESLRPLDPVVRALAALGYVHAPSADDDRCPFFHRPAVWPHTHHIHLVEAGREEERRTLAFRDHLRDHPDVAREYAELKRNLAERFDSGVAADREQYAVAKGAFVERIIRAAIGRSSPVDSRSTSGSDPAPGRAPTPAV